MGRGKKEEGRGVEGVERREEGKGREKRGDERRGGGEEGGGDVGRREKEMEVRIPEKLPSQARHLNHRSLRGHAQRKDMAPPYFSPTIHPALRAYTESPAAGHS